MLTKSLRFKWISNLVQGNFEISNELIIVYFLYIPDLFIQKSKNSFLGKIPQSRNATNQSKADTNGASAHNELWM